MNITPAERHFTAAGVWTTLWKTWEWSTWIKPMIDDARTLGINSLRMIGSTNVVTSGAITQQQYLDRWRQLLDYATSKSLYVLPCGGDLGEWGQATTRARAEALYTAWAQMLSAYARVAGIDITNEAGTASGSAYTFNQPESRYETVKRLGELVREHSRKPITHSRSLTSAGQWRTGCVYTDAISDFIDVHCYVSPAAADADRLHAGPWCKGKQLLIGESGISREFSSTIRAARYTAVKALVTNRTDHVGALVWSGYDTGTSLRDQMGLFDPRHKARTDITNVFKTYPTSR